MATIQPPLLNQNSYTLAKKLLLLYGAKKSDKDEPKINRKVGGTDYEKFEKIAKEIEKEEILSKKEILSQINPNDIKKAKQVYEGVTKPKLEACKIFKNEGDYYLKNKEFNLAINAYEQGLSQLYYNVQDNPEETKQVEQIKSAVDLNLSVAFINIKNYKKAIGYLTEAKRLQGKNLKILYRLALCYFNLKKYDDAKNALNEGLEIDKNNKDFISLLNSVKKQENENNKSAGKMFKKAFQK